MDKTIHHYVLEDDEGKGLFIFEDDAGWWHFSGKLGEWFGKDNTFPPDIKHIEDVLNLKLKHIWSTNDTDMDEAKMDKQLFPK